MLEFGDTIIQPHDFIVIEKSNHKLIGQLIFKATDFNPQINGELNYLHFQIMTFFGINFYVILVSLFCNLAFAFTHVLIAYQR